MGCIPVEPLELRPEVQAVIDACRELIVGAGGASVEALYNGTDLPELQVDLLVRLARAGQLIGVEIDGPTAHDNSAPNCSVSLLGVLPIGAYDLDALPDDLLRKLFGALRLEVPFNKIDNAALCRITLSGETITAAQTTSRGDAGGDPSVPLFPSAGCPRQDSNLRPSD